MSHIGNKLRAGFFATPLTQGEYIKRLLAFEQDTSILDTTCGEGEILAFLASEQPVEISTYGVEIDKGRAEKAAEVLTHCLPAPIESCVISNEVVGLTFCNPPYDATLAAAGDDGTERKEYIELMRATRYLRGGGVMIYIIPSYRFTDKKIARFLATNFEQVAIARFTDNDFADYNQCIFIGYKKRTKHKVFSEKMFDFFMQMDDEQFILTSVSTIDAFYGHRTWHVPAAPLTLPTFYTRLENKNVYVDAIRENKGFEAFKARTQPRSLELGGQPILNISQGQMALLLASGMVNGIIGEGDHLHALQGVEVVTEEHEKEETETGVCHISRTKRAVSVKIITPTGDILKLM